MLRTLRLRLLQTSKNTATCNSTTTRVLVLQLLNIFLSVKENADRFKRANGFLTIAEILSQYPITETIFSELFSILLGSAPVRSTQRENPQAKEKQKPREEKLMRVMSIL